MRSRYLHHRFHHLLLRLYDSYQVLLKNHQFQIKLSNKNNFAIFYKAFLAKFLPFTETYYKKLLEICSKLFIVFLGINKLRQKDFQKFIKSDFSIGFF